MSHGLSSRRPWVLSGGRLCGVTELTVAKPHNGRPQTWSRFLAVAKAGIGRKPDGRVGEAERVETSDTRGALELNDV